MSAFSPEVGLHPNTEPLLWEGILTSFPLPNAGTIAMNCHDWLRRSIKTNTFAC